MHGFQFFFVSPISHLQGCLFQHFSKIKMQFGVKFLSDEFHDITTIFNGLVVKAKNLGELCMFC